MKANCTLRTLQDLRFGLRALKAVEEGVAELGEGPELLLGVDDERVAGDDPVVVAVHHRDESEM